jgi:outer membrane protein assembly factor BamB
MKKISLVLMLAILTWTSCKNDYQPAWRLALKSRSYVEPLIDGEHFYAFSQAGEVIRASIKDGLPSWSETMAGPVLGRPALVGDTLFVITQNGILYAIQSQTGKVNWKVQLPDTFSAPVTIFASNVILPSESGKIYARYNRDGSAAWMFSGALKFNTGALVADDRALIGGWGKNFYSLRPDGSLNWKFTAAERITEDAIRVGNNVYFPSHDHFVYALEIPSGRLIWRFPATQPSNLVAMKDEILFASGKDLIAISAYSGKLIRRLPFQKVIDRVYVNPPNLLLVSHDIYEVSPDFSTVSVRFRGPKPFFKLSFAEGMILASDDLYSIYGYETSIGK